MAKSLSADYHFLVGQQEDSWVSSLRGRPPAALTSGLIAEFKVRPSKTSLTAGSNPKGDNQNGS
jgi:hypothetical protein